MADDARRRNVLVALAGLAVVAVALGWFWFATRDDRAGGDDRWIEYQSSGGFTGATDTLILSYDGSATVDLDQSKPVDFDVPDELMTEVRDAVADVDWPEVSRPPTQPECCDIGYITIRYDLFFAYSSDLTEPPPELEHLIDVLQDVIAAAPDTVRSP
jgi:hypothetical protein